MMSDRQIRRIHHKVYRNGFDNDKVRSITEHLDYLKRARSLEKLRDLAEVVTLKVDRDIARPRLPEFIRVDNYTAEQVPYIEHLGWVLVYLLKRYPEFKNTRGFADAHIKGSEHSMRQGFYETHAFMTIDAGNSSQQGNVTIDVVHGQFDAEKTCWSVEIFADGGLVRKYICETQDQLIAKLDQQLHKYRLVQLAWDRSQNVH